MSQKAEKTLVLNKYIEIQTYDDTTFGIVIVVWI